MINICETSTSRIYTHINENNNWAIVSAWKYDLDNIENHQRMINLRSKVRNKKFGYIPFISKWAENGEVFDEESLFIPKMSKEDAIELGKEFNQSSVIIKNDDGCFEICTVPFVSYEGKKFNIGDIVRKFNTNNKLNIDDAKNIFAGRIGGAASQLLRGSKTSFRLSEVWEIEDPRASYFGVNYRKWLIYSDENLSIADALNELNKLN